MAEGVGWSGVFRSSSSAATNEGKGRDGEAIAEVTVIMPIARGIVGGRQLTRQSAHTQLWDFEAE